MSLKLLTVAAALMGTSSVYSQGWNRRCSVDNLTPAQALERLNWVLRCEKQHFKKQLGSMNNYTYSNDAVFLEDFAMEFRVRVNGNKVTKAGSRRPRYPIFLKNNSTVWKGAPKKATSNCNTRIPSGYTFAGVCISSCYRPEVSLSFENGEIPIQEAHDNGVAEIMVVEPGSLLPSIQLVPAAVETYTSSILPTQHEIIQVTTLSGAQLQITPNHPLLSADGFMREAAEFKVGDALLNYDGQPEEIIEVETQEYFGKVYNVKPEGENTLSNIVVAEGLLSGSSWYQNDGEIYMNRQLMRAAIADSLVEGD